MSLVKIITYIILCINLLIPSKIDKSNRRVVVVEGVVELGQHNRVVVLENPESRSRITYYIEGKLVDQISDQLGRSITILGYIDNERDQRWNRWIRVIGYIEN